MFTASLLGLFVKSPLARKAILERGGYIRVEGGPRISDNRTRCVDRFLQFPGAQWMWMVDADMVLPDDALDMLLAVADPENQPIVGGLCFAGRDGQPPKPTMNIMGVNDDGSANLQMVADWPRGQVLRVDTTGAACLLVHRSVLEKMAEHFPRPYPWFAETYMTGSQIGEDATFCLRARQLGYPVAVHTGVSVGHRKTTTIDLNTYERDALPQHRAQAEACQGAPREGELAMLVRD